jgi:hypothetical protein
LLIQSHIKKGLQLADDIVVGKIKSIQAEADRDLVDAEATQQAKELTEARLRLAKIQDDAEAAMNDARKLFNELSTHLAEAGKDEEESQQILNVPLFSRSS